MSHRQPFMNDPQYELLNPARDEPKLVGACDLHSWRGGSFGFCPHCASQTAEDKKLNDFLVQGQARDRWRLLVELFKIALPLQRARLLGDRETIAQAAMREAKEALALLDDEMPLHMKPGAP